MKPLRFEIVFVVWGNKYTKLFLDIVIPSYLSINNIPLASRRYELICKVYTTCADLETINTHLHFQKLSEIIRVETFPMITEELLKSTNKYGAMAHCHLMALNDAISNRAIIVLSSPDAIITDGGLCKCCSFIEAGKKAVNIASLGRAEIESILPHLLSHLDLASSSLKISNKSLIELGMKHLHRITKMQFWHGEIFSHWPSALYWKAGNNSVLAKFFHLHPFIVDLRGVQEKLPKTLMCIDGGLLELLGIFKDQIQTITDSEEFACLELSSNQMESFGFLPCSSEKKYSSLLRFAFNCTLPSHIKQFLTFNFHYQAQEEVNWEQIERKQAQDLRLMSFLLVVIQKFNQSLSFCNHSLRKIGKKIGLKYLKDKIALLQN